VHSARNNSPDRHWQATVIGRAPGTPRRQSWSCSPSLAAAPFSGVAVGRTTVIRWCLLRVCSGSSSIVLRLRPKSWVRAIPRCRMPARTLSDRERGRVTRPGVWSPGACPDAFAASLSGGVHDAIGRTGGPAPSFAGGEHGPRIERSVVCWTAGPVPSASVDWIGHKDFDLQRIGRGGRAASVLGERLSKRQVTELEAGSRNAGSYGRTGPRGYAARVGDWPAEPGREPQICNREASTVDSFVGR
jgi:hypothetical protein